MNLLVKKTLSLQGKVTIPGSKSQSIRALLLALLAKGESVLANVLDSDDTQVAHQVCAALGATMTRQGDACTIESGGLPLKSDVHEIHTGNSGITTLFTLPLLGLRHNCMTPIVLTCGEQMRARPVKSLVQALRCLGMVIDSIHHDEALPLRVSGRLTGGVAEVDGSHSQYLSALLLSLPCADNVSTISVKDLQERPYVEMTLSFLDQQGIHYTHSQSANVDTFIIQGQQRYTALHQVIHGDFSSASCLIAAAALVPGHVALQGLDFNDTQGDKKLVSLLQAMGADIQIENDSLRILGNKPLRGIRIDANAIPDLVPALAIIATQAIGKTEIVNVAHARLKETDRIHSMATGLRKMGARLEEHHDGLTIYQSQLQGAGVEGFHDHRTVMAFSVAGLIAAGETTISDAEAINKTYPRFIDSMKTLGANFSIDSDCAHKSIILIGFKHVGKSVVGRALAQSLNKKFIDLDHEIESRYQKHYGEALTCRQMVQTHGEPFFRALESQALAEVIHADTCVIALGGGTVVSEINQRLIENQRILHVNAPRGMVFERIMVEGRPAFFDPNKDPYEAFDSLWTERNKIYQQLTPYAIDNSTTVVQAVNQALQHLQQQIQAHHSLHE